MKYTIDLQKIADELEFDLYDIEMLMDIFIESAYENLENLTKAISKSAISKSAINNHHEHDFETIFQTAHAIKGSAANIMLNDIAAIAQEIENNARGKKLVNYQNSSNKLKLSIKALVCESA